MINNHMNNRFELFPSSCELHQRAVDSFGPDNVGVTIDQENIKLFDVTEEEVKLFVQSFHKSISYTSKDNYHE